MDGEKDQAFLCEQINVFFIEDDNDGLGRFSSKHIDAIFLQGESIRSWELGVHSHQETEYATPFQDADIGSNLPC